MLGGIVEILFGSNAKGKSLEAVTKPLTSVSTSEPSHEAPAGVASVMSVLVSTTVDLARIQFATTSLYHFLFVPLTLGLAPLVAVMQTLWHRSGDEAWLRLTKFFGTLMLINFAIGVATGPRAGVPVRDELVGLLEVRRQRLRRAARDRGARRVLPRVDVPRAVDLRLEPPLAARAPATIWLAALGTWLSAYFILVANSWMQHPVGYKVVNGQAQLTSVWALLTGKWALWAFGHTILAGLEVGFRRRVRRLRAGISCAGATSSSSSSAAKLALIVLVPVSAVNLWFGSNFGIVVTERAADEDLRDRGAVGHLPAVRLLALPDRRLQRRDDQTPTFSIQIPKLLSFLATGSFNGKVQGLERAPVAGGAASTAVAATTSRPSRRSTGHADDGVPRHARVPRRGARCLPVLAATARARALVPVDGVVAIAFPYHRRDSPAGS